MSISVLKYTPAGIRGADSAPFLLNTASSLAQTRQALGLIEGTILLPMPVNVGDRNSVNWDGSKLDPIAMKAYQVAKDAVLAASVDDPKNTNPVATINNVLKSLAGNTSSVYSAVDQSVRNAIRDRLIAGAVNVFNANVDPATILARESGQVLNPNLELTFQGVELRQFDFSFKLTPRSKEEGDEVKAIINTFKRRMAPATSPGENATSAGIFLQAPSIFQVEFKKGRSKHPFLYTMKPAALKSMEVNYADGAPYGTYWDGTPVSMELKLSFKELNPIYAEDYRITDLGGGVGF